MNVAEKKRAKPPSENHVVELWIKNFGKEIAKIKDFGDPHPSKKSIVGHYLANFAKSTNPRALNFLRETLRGAKSEAQAIFLLSALLGYGGTPAVEFILGEFSDKASARIMFWAEGAPDESPPADLQVQQSSDPESGITVSQPGRLSGYRALIAISIRAAKSPEAIPALAAHLKKSRNPSVRILCATAIGEIWDSLESSLAPDLESRKPEVREKTERTLAGLRDAAMDALEPALRDKNAQVREHAALAIAETGDAAAIGYFREISGSYLEQDIEHAVKNLIKIRDKRVVPVLAKVISDDKAKWLTPPTRRALAVALGETGDKRAIPALVELAEQEQNGETQVAIVHAIGKIGGEEALAALEKLIRPAPGETTNSAEAANAALLRMTLDRSEKLECIPHPNTVEDLKRKDPKSIRKKKRLTSG